METIRKEDLAREVRVDVRKTADSTIK